MIFNHRYFNFCSFVLVLSFISSVSTATSFCSNLTSTDDKDTPCFLEPSADNPRLLRSSGNSLVLPCHVARSKHSTIEWWYQDFQKTVNIKIYPVFPAVRPTVLRFITSTSPITQNSNETDIMDVSVLLRHVNVDDSGIYQCVIRPWAPAHTVSIQDNLLEDYSNLPALSYHVELTGPRLCQSNLGTYPCFSNMRTSSPTIIDAYQTAFLQCVVHNFNRKVNVLWVVGNASVNSVLVTDYLTTNQNNGDRLRRVFPLSPFDYSIELTVNRDIPERTYSCVIGGTNDAETTLFTYIVRTIDLEDISSSTMTNSKNGTTGKILSENDKSSMKTENILSHDSLNSQEVDELRQKTAHEQTKTKDEQSNIDDDDDDLLDIYTRDDTPATKKS